MKKFMALLACLLCLAAPLGAQAEKQEISSIDAVDQGVDVNEEKYLFNQNVEGIGSSTSINFWKIGEPSRAKAVKRGVTDCMEFFLTSFE